MERALALHKGMRMMDLAGIVGTSLVNEISSLSFLGQNRKGKKSMWRDVS